MAEFLRFPQVTNYVVGGETIYIPDLIEEYKSNGHNDALVAMQAYNISNIRTEHGFVCENNENWFAAEAFLALNQVSQKNGGRGIDIVEFSRKSFRKVKTPDERNEDHFQPQDQLVVWVGSDVPDLIGEPRFMEATSTLVKGDYVFFCHQKRLV